MNLKIYILYEDDSKFILRVFELMEKGGVFTFRAVSQKLLIIMSKKIHILVR